MVVQQLLGCCWWRSSHPRRRCPAHQHLSPHVCFTASCLPAPRSGSWRRSLRSGSCGWTRRARSWAWPSACAPRWAPARLNPHPPPQPNPPPACAPSVALLLPCLACRCTVFQSRRSCVVLPALRAPCLPDLHAFARCDALAHCTRAPPPHPTNPSRRTSCSSRTSRWSCSWATSTAAARCTKSTSSGAPPTRAPGAGARRAGRPQRARRQAAQRGGAGLGNPRPAPSLLCLPRSAPLL